MNKIIVFLLIVFLVGCGSTSIESDLKNEFSQSEIVIKNNFEFTILNAYRTFTDDPFYLDDGYLFVVVNIKIRNTSNEKQSVNTFNWKMQNGQGVEVDASWLSSFGSNSFSGELLPGGEIEGYLAFEEPIDNSDLKLAYYESPFNEAPDFVYKIECDCNVKPLEKEIFEINEIVTYNDIQYRVSDVLWSSGKDYYEPKNGNQFLGVVVNTTNLSQGNIDISSNNWKIVDSNGVQYSSTYFHPFEQNEYPTTTLLSGGEVNGIIVFEVPVDKELSLVFYRDPYKGLSKFSFKLN